MFYNLRKSINTWLFNVYARKVTKLLPVHSSSNSRVTVVTQLCSRDLIMYLVAIKTFTRYVPPKAVVIVADKLSDKDVATLAGQIENLTIINLNEVNDERFPKGGCWERLLTILSICKNNYVIQLDADTLTLKSPTEVLQCIDENKCFTLGTDEGQNFIPFSEATKFIKERQWSGNHVQSAAELSMEAVDVDKTLKYVRGCAGFAGFSSNALGINRLAEICGRIENTIGKDKWRQWGSEQVASNIVIANSSAEPMVLPITKYDFFKPSREVELFTFLHFIGSFRFETNDYRELAIKEINHLMK